MVKKTENIIDSINKAKKGDETSYTFLLNIFWKDIYRFILTKSNDENEAEDLTIRTFAKAFDKIDTFDENYEFKTWLISIANNLFIDQLRKKKTETISLHKKNSEAYKIEDEEPTPDDQLIIEQNLAQLLAYIKLLKPHYQEIINLRFFQEMSYKEMAKELDEPMSNIKVKLLRAKKLLAEIINSSK
ncbi:sigma-70 family RNA polymerase sigma factor [Aureibaculum sp. 2210JD6-5]|uniref:RNA polymerase sigma factor n=1 Tax=Aureibaculum sp. 2210JD6-5 TaxID=3103957 RepID=UPI002AAE3691|nr:sigma-70 family RNA polymerase sigma factor [Aureibaculum sp. 2210JD6-5]MDY7396937.1 sigma-70 family RNA polymerase sigma factor [Aureibaculum sp. 2210JD6-5]